MDFMTIFLKFNHCLQGHLSSLISKVRWRSKIIYMKFYRAVFFKKLIFMRTKMNIFWGGREIFILSRNKTLFQSENNGTLKFSRIFSPKQTLNLKKKVPLMWSVIHKCTPLLPTVLCIHLSFS